MVRDYLIPNVSQENLNDPYAHRATGSITCALMSAFVIVRAGTAYRHLFAAENMFFFVFLYVRSDRKFTALFMLCECRYVEYLSESLTGCSLQP